MPLDTRIPLAAVQPRNTLTDSYAQAMQLKAAQQQAAMQDLALQRDQERRNALKGAYGPEGVDYSKAEAALVGVGDIEGALGLRKQAADEKRLDMQSRADKAKALIATVDAESRLLGGVTDESTYQAARQRGAAMGLDVSDWPAMYNPRAVAAAINAGLDAKSRIQIGLEREKAEFSRADKDRKYKLDERRTAAYERGASQTNIHMPGALSARPLTPQEAQAFGIPPENAGYMMIDAKGNLKARPLAPGEQQMGKAEADAQITATSNAKAYGVYAAARKGLDQGLRGTTTNPIAGRLPALTAEAQVGEAAIAAMAPALKQLFRTAGEGTFTDKDQQMLLDMIPSRKIHPEARAAIIENIDRIVRAKLGIPETGGPVAPPKVGDIVNGYRFKGGNPASPESWESP